MNIKTLLFATCIQTAMFCIICTSQYIQTSMLVSSAHASINSDGQYWHPNNVARGGYSSAQSDSTSQGGNASITENRQYRRNPANTAYAPRPSIPRSDSCVFSTGVGGSAVTFSLSFGTVFKDEDCTLRKDAWLLRNMGYFDTARYMLCSNERFALAFKQASYPCPVVTKVNVVCRDRECMRWK